jgi:hypothetical protein
VAPPFIAPVDCEPLRALVPDHEPEAEHTVAFFVDQVMVEVLPAATVLGSALSVMIGASAATVTVADCVAEPPLPVHVSSYSVVLSKLPVDHVPLVATTPLQPPEATQWVAFWAFQFREVEVPAATVAEEAVIVTVGAGEITTTSADCDVEPPGPVQVSVKLVVSLSGLVVAVPLVG